MVNSVTMSVMLLRSKGGGAEGEPTPAGEKVRVSMRADKSVWTAFSLPALTLAFSLQRVFERQGHPRARYGLALDLLVALNDSTIGSDHPKQDGHPKPNSQKGAT